MRSNIVAFFLQIFMYFFCAGYSTAFEIYPDVLTIIPHNQWVRKIDKAGIIEPSGICYHAERGTIFVVGDEGDIYEIETNGTLIKQKRIDNKDFEGITYDPSSGLLYAAVEGEEIIVEIHPSSFEIIREFSIPSNYVGEILLSNIHGIEGVTFVPDYKHNEGGTFFIASQAFSAIDGQYFSTIFQVELPLLNTVVNSKIIGYFRSNIVDLSGLHFDSKTGHIFVISDERNTIFEYEPTGSGTALEFYFLPGNKQEGITIDEKEFLYIAQDSGGIIKLKLFRGQ